MNVVVMKGVNDAEVPALIRYAHARGITPRFIELMPFGQGEPVPTQALVDRLLAQGWELAPDDSVPTQLSGPARYYRAPSGHVGFITPLTQNFCGGCNRVRVASNGDLRSCLGGRAQAPLHTAHPRRRVGPGAGAAIRAALGEKPDGHSFADTDARAKLLPMMGIGG